MICSMLCAGQAAQKSLTTWILPLSAEVGSAASARGFRLAIPARPNPAAVKAERRVTNDRKALLVFTVLSLFRRQNQFARLRVPFRSVRLAPEVITDNPRHEEILRVYNDRRDDHVILPGVSVEVVILREHGVGAEGDAVIANIARFQMRGHHF